MASCARATTCEAASRARKNGLACISGRELYAKYRCDDVGRGYGRKGKQTPKRLANRDRARHKKELNNAREAQKKCASKIKQLCKCL